jgi:hypothetical protein
LREQNESNGCTDLTQLLQASGEFVEW